MGIHTKTLMVTGSASISGSLHFDGVLPASLTVGTDSAADRKIVFGHTNVKTVIGLDHDSGDANNTIFAINTDANFESGNDLEINSSGDVTLANGDLYVRGGDIYGIENGQLRLRSDSDVIVTLDDDGGHTSEFKVNNGDDVTKFSVDESGNTHIEGTMRIDGNSILGSTGGTPIQWNTSDHVTIGGDITIGGNDIKNSEGTTTMTLDANEDVTFASNIMMGNNKELQGISNVTINYDQDNNGTGNLNIKSGGTTVMNINNAGVIETMPAIGGTNPTLTIGDNGNELVKVIIDNQNQDYAFGTPSTGEEFRLVKGTDLNAGNAAGFLMTTGSFVKTPQGILSSTSVRVLQYGNSGNDVHTQWIKIATHEGLGSFGRSNAVFMVSLAPYGDGQFEHDEYFIVRVRYCKNATGGVDTEVTDLCIEPFNQSGKTQVDDTDFILTYNGTSEAALWMRSPNTEIRYGANVFVDFLHSHNLSKGAYNSSTYDYNTYGNWNIENSSAWQASYESLGVDVAARYTSKKFDKVHITSTQDAGLNSDQPALSIGSLSGAHILIDNNEIMAKNGESTASSLYFQHSGGAGVYIGGANTGYGGLVYKTKGDTINDGFTVQGNTVDGNTIRMWIETDGTRRLSGGSGDNRVIEVNQAQSSTALGMNIGGKLGVNYSIEPQLSTYTPYCAFSVLNSSTDENLARRTSHTLEFNSEIFDYGGNFTGDTFTAPKTGVYSLETTVRLQGLSSENPAYIRLSIVTSNRVYYRYFDASATAVNTYPTFDVKVLADMDANDTAYVQLYIYHASSTAASTVDVHGSSSTISTWFAGHLVLQEKTMNSITIQISDLDKKILEDQLLDIQDWLQSAINGKANSIKKRLVKSEIERLVNDPTVTNVPASPEDIVTAYFAQEGYKNRAERETSPAGDEQSSFE